MDKFEIKPRILNPVVIIFGVIALGTTLLFAVMILPKLFQNIHDYPGERAFTDILIVVEIVFSGVWLSWLVAALSSFAKTIRVEGNLVYFRKKRLLGFGRWYIDKVIDFSKVIKISDVRKVTYVSAHNSLIPIPLYWMIVETEDKNKQEIFLNGWDFGSIKNLIFYLRGKFPRIKFNSMFFKDSNEKLSGIDEYLKK